MKNLIKKSEIGPIMGKCESIGWHIINRYEKQTGQKLPTVLVQSNRTGGSGRRSCVAFKISDIAKATGMKQKDIRREVENLRSRENECLDLAIYQPKK